MKTADMQKIRVVLLAAVVAWTTTMLTSLKFGFFNIFLSRAVGTSQRLNCQGLDFFQVPCGFRNLIAGNSIFLTEISDYVDYATSYFNHPLLAVIVGPWTFWLPPSAAYGLFVAALLSLLAFAAWLLASVFESPAAKAFAYFALFCSTPTYLMLWAGQMHGFVVLAIAMILAGLMQLEQNPQASARYVRWIQAGILISLFSKPVALLMLPALFLLPETRRKMISPVAIYAGVSLLFLLVPRLNPGGYNAVHWFNLFHASLSPVHTFQLVAPIDLDYSNSYVIFSLPRLLQENCHRTIVLAVVAATLMVVLAESALAMLFAERSRRIRAAVAAVALCVLSHFLCYYIAFEYQYTSMLPLLPTPVWLRSREESRRLRALLTAALLSTACVLLPTPQFIWHDNLSNYWTASAIMRVVPAAAAFWLLSVYGFATAWLQVRGQLLECAKQASSQLRSSARPIVISVLLLAAVLTTAFATAPNRLLSTPHRWTRNDWREHFEDIISRPGVSAESQRFIRRQLAAVYAETNETPAVRQNPKPVGSPRAATR